MDLAGIRTETLLLAGQSSFASQSMWTDAEADGQINSYYETLQNEARQLGTGYGISTTEINTVADVIEHALPADFDGRVNEVLIANVGVDFTVTPPAPGNHKTLEPSALWDEAITLYRQGRLDSTQYYTWENNQVLVLPPPSTSQTGGLYVSYAALHPALAADIDVPVFGATHHRLLAYGAAKILRGIRELDWPQALADELDNRFSLFMEDMSEIVREEFYQIPTAGLSRRHAQTSRTGRVRKIPVVTDDAW